MPINLDNVNISIRQFQAISSGKYNAGEVKLKNATTLVEINNHVHWAGRNVKAISHDEVLAIKDAFVRALSQSGVGADAINRVRRELGLAPEGPADMHQAALPPADPRNPRPERRRDQPARGGRHDPHRGRDPRPLPARGAPGADPDAQPGQRGAHAEPHVRLERPRPRIPACHSG